MQRNTNEILHEKNFMKMLPKSMLFAITALLAVHIMPAQAAEESEYLATPPFLSTETGVKPNILFILDNSNSMDEDVDGEAVGGDSSLSKSEIARKAIKEIIEDQKNNMRFGLMAYRQQNVKKYYIHNSFYYCSYDPATYDPDGTPTPKDPATNTKRFPNPTDDGHYIYYDTALPFYTKKNSGNAFCYSKDFTYPENGVSHVYWCYHNKTAVFTGTPPVETGTPTGRNKAELSSWGYANNFLNTKFFPTDSDIAAGFSKFGYENSWVPIGPTWYANGSPGGGILHTNIADSDTAHINALFAKLATSQFDDPIDTPLRNAGLTPIEGTMVTARKYFKGKSVVAAAGVQAQNPIIERCQKNYVILLTDGLPSVNKNGNQGSADDLLAATETSIGELRSITNNSFPGETFDVQTYVIGFAIPEMLGAKLDELAEAGGTDKALIANNAEELAQKLRDVMFDISKKAASGTSASVIANGRTGEGLAYQSTFYQSFTDEMEPEHTVNWVGMVRSLFVDSYGNLREDTNKNHQYDIGEDCFVVYRHSGATVMARKYRDTNENSMLDIGEDLNNNGKLDTGEDRNLNGKLDGVTNEDSNNNNLLDPGEDLNGNGVLDVPDKFVGEVTLFNLNYVWESNTWLNGISTASIDDQRSYTDNNDSTDEDYSNDHRYIFTFVDKDGDKIVDSGEQLDFVESNSATLQEHLLVYPNPDDAPSWINEPSRVETASQRIINYIRGEEQGSVSVYVDGVLQFSLPAMRSRLVDYDGDGELEPWRLGDFVHSSPVSVGAPAEALHLLYNDTDYADFARKYRKRRTVVYAGGNDGMIHAFNGGFYDHKKHKVTTVSITNPEPFIDKNGDGVRDPNEDFTDRNYNGEYDDGRGNENEYPLGSELWAYVPYNLLPQLRFLTSAEYGKGERHIYFNDLTPRVFDAKIFTPEDVCSETGGLLKDGCVHPHGWGTVLVSGMGFGGGFYPKSRHWDFKDDDLGWTFSPEEKVSTHFIDDTWVITADNLPPSQIEFSGGSFISPAVNIDANIANTIEIRFSKPAGSAGDPAAGGATLYWNKTGGSEDWPAMNSVTVATPQENSSDTYTYTFHMAASSEWSETVKRLRIVLNATVTQNAQVAVDYINIGSGEGYTSSYCLFDITNPEKPPVALAELNARGLGFTTGTPTVIPIRDMKNDVNDWYLVFGSGPNHDMRADKTALETATSNTRARVYVVSLKDLVQQKTLKMLDSNGGNPANSGGQVLKNGEQVFAEFDDNTFISDFVTIDLGLDYDADVTYFGTVSGSSTAGWGGKMRRLLFDDGNPDTTKWIGDSTLFDLPAGQTITAAATVGVDDRNRYWVYFGTGRYFIRDDESLITTQQYYGIKEPLDEYGNLAWSEVDKAGLLDTTNVQVYDDRIVKFGGTTGTWQQLLNTIDTKAGWTIDLEREGERSLSRAALLGGVLSFATYTPSTDPCVREGSSDGYALYYKTGTAYYEPVLGIIHDDWNHDGKEDSGEMRRRKKFSIGSGLASSPAVHTGSDDGSSVIFQASDGSLFSVEEDNPGLTKSKKTGWKSFSD